MRAEDIQNIESSLGLSSAASELTAVEGGFTGAQKFVLKTHESGQTPREFFVKYADLTTNPREAVVLDTEANMYQIISRMENVRKYFPGYKDYKRTDKSAALFLEYLPGLSWGGPWSQQNIEMLASALEEVHNTPVDELTAQEITEHAKSLRAALYEQDPYTIDDQKKARLFDEAVVLDNGTFTNSRGQLYAQLSPQATKEIIDAAEAFDPDTTKKFCVVDLNFGNIGFAPNQVYFVDPVYIQMGNPSPDMVNVGINILRTLPQDEYNTNLAERVKTTFLTDKNAFAHSIQYWVACTSLPYRGEKDPWMDYHQESAVTALNTWKQMYA